MDSPAAPEGAGPAGARLWSAVLAEFELAEHELTLLRQAVRVADLCDQLQTIMEKDGPMLTVDGQPSTHPAVVELRQQRIMLARLIVALRVPVGDQEDEQAIRPQRRPLRGVYALGDAG
jgi:hypothetical protein